MNNILIIFIVIGIFAFLVGRWQKIAFKHVEYKRYLDKERVFVNEKVKMTTEVINRKVLPLPWIQVYAEIPNEFNLLDQKVTMINEKSKKIYRLVTSLISFQRIRKYSTFYCNKRGYYSVYSAKLSIGDILGFTVAEKEIECPILLIVYPEIKPLENLVIQSRGIQGDVSVKRWILPDNTQIAGVREYSSMDSFNTIDWKATARVGELHVKNFDFTAEPTLMTILNVQTSKIHWQDINTERIERGIEIIASIAQKSISEKVAIGYTSNAYFNGEAPELFIQPRMNLSQKLIILEALAKTSYVRRTDIEEIFRTKIRSLSSNSLIILLTSYISDGLRNELNYLARRGNKAKVILLDNSADIGYLDKNIEILLSNKFA